ncbi:hypothetical protein ACEPPN_007556 [Leptodophora sp. 'Broadleaf-Isolate-01']
MSFEPLGTGTKEGNATLNGKDFAITWICDIPTIEINSHERVENTPYKNMVERIACQAAGRVKPGQNYDTITIRAASHSRSRVGGARSSVFIPDDPHLTINYGPGPVGAASHVYVGPADPQKITQAAEFANVNIWRKNDKPSIKWWDKKN